MEINFYFKNGKDISYISTKEIMKFSHLIIPENVRKPNFITLEAGRTKSELEGEQIIINAETYSINGKTYELTECFGVAAILHGTKVFPILRSARQLEKKVFQKTIKTRFDEFTVGPGNHYWPRVVKI